MNWLAQLWSALSVIPGAVWGYIGGVLSTIVISNRHDRKMRKIERDMAFRKEVFGGMAEAMMAGMQAIGRHVDLTLAPNMVTKDFNEKAPAAAKAHLIARQKTIKALVDIMTEFGNVFLRLGLQRGRIVNLQERIGIHDAMIANLGKQRDDLGQMLRHHNIEGNPDRSKWDRIEHSFLFEMKRVNTLLEEQREMKVDLRVQHIALVKKCCEEVLRLGHLIPPLLVAAREEMDNAMDLEEYAKILERGRQRTQAELEAFFKELEGK